METLKIQKQKESFGGNKMNEERKEEFRQEERQREEERHNEKYRDYEKDNRNSLIKWFLKSLSQEDLIEIIMALNLGGLKELLDDKGYFEFVKGEYMGGYDE